MAPKPKPTSISPVKEARGIPTFTKILLFTRAAGRCEFDGCNENVLENPITLRAGNYAELAHIVAFQPDGPRGKDSTRPGNINAIENLMLLCQRCHKEIDDSPTEYPRTRLEAFKTDHERRISRLAELGPDRRTSILVLKAPIGGSSIAISGPDIHRAALPRYPASRSGTEIDLNELAIVGEQQHYLETARSTIDARLAQLFSPEGEASRVGHLSIFALGPIPLLVHLGAQLTNKVAADLFQRHRDTESWG